VKTENPQHGKGLVLTGPTRNAPLLFGSTNVPLAEGKKVWNVGEVLNQHTTSACVGFSWGQFLQSEPVQTVPAKDMFGYCFDLYREAQRIDQWPGEEPQYYGTSIEAGWGILKNRGLVKDCLAWGTSIEQIAKYVLERGCVNAGTPWYEGMNTISPQGFCSITGASQGGHAWLIYGVSTFKGQEYFMGVNSWGSGWGLNGRFKITFDDMKKLLREGGYVCSGQE